eukprot:TRINITY_DN10222_c0_g3_i3.p1 TRINITY_DN10222_c0_g3~~TRINITY_DN10222_c0_g3_i3.p1  ORF type:complete len:836 (-),score=186.06 TRINITY_DN10222_c0_g3_i3:121-2628(-)
MYNGTSMASPNCCGCLALIISGLKSKNIPYSSHSLKRDLENAALFDKSRDIYTQGRGLVQVINTFELAMKYHSEHFVKYLVTMGSRRGFFIKQLHEMVPTEITLNCELLFTENTTPEQKTNFERRIQLLSTTEWAKAPQALHLTNEGRSFRVMVDPTGLQEGQHHYAEIQGWDINCLQKGPVFRFPITVIYPLSLPPGEHTKSFAKQEFTPGQVHRYFVSVPVGATWACVTLLSHDISPKKLFSYQHNMFLPHQSLHDTMFHKYFWLGDQTKTKFNFDVQARHTLEVNLAHYWSSSGGQPVAGSVDLTLQFHGLELNSYGVPLQCSLGENVQMEMRATLREESVKPVAYLTTHQRQLTPTSSIINPLSERDLLPENRQIYQMINTYIYTANEACDVITCLPTISKLLYESPFESQFWQVFNENNLLVGSGDFHPHVVNLPRKGKYMIRVQFRDNDLSVLNKLKSFPLVVDRLLPKDKQVPVSLYPSLQAALVGNPKVSSNPTKLAKGDIQMLVLGSPDTTKIPKDVSSGDVLRGYLSLRNPKSEVIPFALPESGMKVPPVLGGTFITFVVNASVTNNQKNKSQTCDCCDCCGGSCLGIVGPKKKPSSPSEVEENFMETRRQYSFNYLRNMIKKGKLEQAEVLLESFMKEYPSSLPLLEIKLRYHCKCADLSPLDARLLKNVLEAADAVIKMIDRNSLALYFGTRHEGDDEAKDYNQLKETLQATLQDKANALFYLYKCQGDDLLKIGFFDTLTELNKWVKLAEDSNYLDLSIKKEKLNKSFGNALKYLNKALGNSNEQELLVLQIELLTVLGWQHCVENRKANLVSMFPPNQKLF